MKSAEILKRAGWIFVQPIDKTVTGVGISGQPVTKMADSATPEVLGGVVIGAMEAARIGIPHPTDWKSLPQHLMKAVGVRSRTTLMKGALHCNITEEQGDLVLTPSENAGSREGFRYLPELELRLKMTGAITPNEIGEGVIECLARCR